MNPQSQLVHRFVQAGPVRLHLVESGGGAPVVLLHGFPEFWYSWRRQIPALAAAGFRVLVPDLRGYNQSDQPCGVREYRLSALVEDIAGLIRSETGGSAHVVGHDWGGVIAWRLAALYPQLVQKLVILNAAHPAAYRRELQRNPGQWLRAWYVLFFQLPRLPEYLLRRRSLAALDETFQKQPVHPEAFTQADIVEYKRTFAPTGAFTGPLNYYRAAMRYPRDLFAEPQTVAAPTLLIWGEKEPFASIRLTQGLERWVPNLRVERIADASHWVQNDVPERVNALLVDFLRR